MSTTAGKNVVWPVALCPALPSLAPPASKSHTALALDSWVSKTLRKAVLYTHKLCNCRGEAQERERIQAQDMMASERGKNKLPLQ